MGKCRRLESKFHITSQQRIINNMSVIAHHCPPISFKFFLSVDCLPVIRSGYFTTILSGGISGLFMVEGLLNNQEKDYIQERFFCVAGVICKELFIMNSETIIKQAQPKLTVKAFNIILGQKLFIFSKQRKDHHSP